MVVKTNSLSVSKRGGSGFAVYPPQTPTPHALAPHPYTPHAPLARRITGPSPPDYFVVPSGVSVETEDVIDLGAPRRMRTAPINRLRAQYVSRNRRPYTPNPRLYPGPASAAKTKRKEDRTGAEGARRRKRVYRRPVPNSRLYRPASRPPAASPSQPPVFQRPRASWPPPGSPNALDTASHAALRLAERRQPLPLAQAHARGAAASAGRRLMVRMPAAGDAPRASRPRAPEALNRHPTSQNCLDCAETASAPSEHLAEFLSAVMRRQYAEALKYCRMILQYEPQNATAQGFYPLLQLKLQKDKKSTREKSTSSEEPCELRFNSKKAESRKSVLGQEAEEFGSKSSRSGGRLACSRRPRSCLKEASSNSLLDLDSSFSASLSQSDGTNPMESTSSAATTSRGWRLGEQQVALGA